MSGISRAASAPVTNSEQYQRLKERLAELKKAQPSDNNNAAILIEQMTRTRKDLSEHLTTCHSVLETSSHCLESFFRNLPSTRLQQAIDEKFDFFDRDHDGTLCRNEVREGMAEMGQRPTDDELDIFISLFDHNNDGRIDRKEFAQMVKVKLQLVKLPEAKSAKNVEESKKEESKKEESKKEESKKDTKKTVVKSPVTAKQNDVIG